MTSDGGLFDVSPVFERRQLHMVWVELVRQYARHYLMHHYPSGHLPALQAYVSKRLQEVENEVR